MQIVYQSKKHGFVTLYVTATDNSHCSEWVASLRQGERGSKTRGREGEVQEMRDGRIEGGRQRVSKPAGKVVVVKFLFVRQLRKPIGYCQRFV